MDRSGRKLLDMELGIVVYVWFVVGSIYPGSLVTTDEFNMFEEHCSLFAELFISTLALFLESLSNKDYHFLHGILEYTAKMMRWG